MIKIMRIEITANKKHLKRKLFLIKADLLNNRRKEIIKMKSLSFFYNLLYFHNCILGVSLLVFSILYP